MQEWNVEMRSKIQEKTLLDGQRHLQRDFYVSAKMHAANARDIGIDLE